MLNEADTCRRYVLPALYTAGWIDDQIKEQRTLTPGRILITGGKVKRGKPKRVARHAYDEWRAKSATCEAPDREQVREIITERSHPDLEFELSVHWLYSIGITCPARGVATGRTLVKRLRQVLQQVLQQVAPIGVVAIAKILGEPPITIQEELHRLWHRGKVAEDSPGAWRWKARLWKMWGRGLRCA